MGYQRTLDGKIDIFEMELSNERFLEVKESKVLVSLNQFYYRRPQLISISERIEIIESKLTNVNVIGFLIKLTPKFFETQTLADEIVPLQAALVKKFHLPVYVDMPQIAPSNKGNDDCLSLDPLWTRPNRGGLWKIHGWHPTRWVRRYSKAELNRLNRLARRYHPDFIIFGHSQREQQIKEFIEIQSMRSET